MLILLILLFGNQPKTSIGQYVVAFQWVLSLMGGGGVGGGVKCFVY